MTSTHPASPSAPDAISYFGIEVPFMQHIGLRPLRMDNDSCHTLLAMRPDLVNSRGDIHGGTLMSAFDFTLSGAARAHDPQRLGVITVDMTTHFYEPARTDLTVIGRCTRRGKSLAFCEGEIVDAAGTVVAVARAVFKLVARQPA
ncbi:PaaI family thioesterase [Pseudorhodoferax sp. Leaf274]|uniref:PaaI family thioesterase n=1 Tax=Pseudorhodoferax sp. Leaf274 TaxID=1736318 RepID=UPI0007035E53|nr:PaaI family thioesterase [Pseudorhodoferax sp. Leaf274]KQP37511.1 phenylacetic acid degradation protein [Pseudorhodoferax sp. Leaf274]